MSLQALQLTPDSKKNVFEHNGTAQLFCQKDNSYDLKNIQLHIFLKFSVKFWSDLLFF